MKTRLVKISVSVIIFLVVVYNSIYIKKLSEVKASTKNEFDAATYAEQFWQNSLMPQIAKCIEIGDLIDLLKSDPEKAFQMYSHALGIGNLRYFLVQGQGTATDIKADHVLVSLKSDSIENRIVLATEFIYGNAVRDATGTIDFTEFVNTMNLNRVSAEINKKIRQEVIPPFRENVSSEDEVHFIGAIELNRSYLNLDSIEVIPVSLQILSQE